MESEIAGSSLKLTGSNHWPTWKFQIKVILKGRGLYELVTGELVKPAETEKPELLKQWMKNDAKAQEMLVTRMDQGPLSHLLSCETAKEMWTKLNTVYQKESEVRVHLLQQKIFSLEYENESMSDFFSKIEHIQTKLKECKEPVSDEMVMTKILMALPESYKHFRSAWESVPNVATSREFSYGNTTVTPPCYENPAKRMNCQTSLESPWLPAGGVAQEQRHHKLWCHLYCNSTDGEAECIG
ncbi:uncharacterized protein [Choristoneura fumiferana]|uniref:uncharacterized protein n=1 Tax=Choristoneura fumiferana TaxID=7141 RepID=UPI003D154200